MKRVELRTQKLGRLAVGREGVREIIEEAAGRTIP